MMRTTLLSPTFWLLAAAAATAAGGALRGEKAHQALERVIRFASRWPVLITLLVMAAGGVGSRIVLGFLAPDASAEQAAAGQRFLEFRRVQSSGSTPDLGASSSNEVVLPPPWQPLPDTIGCPARTMADRIPLFTTHAHTPTLLLGEIPVVQAGGSRTLFSVLVLLSFAAVAGMAAVVVRYLGLGWRSRHALLVIAAIAGWQPVLAGIRQGDAVLPAAGLAAAAWLLAARDRRIGAAVAASVAACLTASGIGVLAALVCCAPRIAATAIVLFAVAVATTVAVAGVAVIPGFLETSEYAARAYADVLTNYAVGGRVIAGNLGSPAALGLLSGAVVFSWWRRSAADGGFATFLTLGLLTAPVLWSQHLAFVLVPAVVLLRRLSKDGSSAALMSLALLLLLFSLPDPAAALLNGVLSVRISPDLVVPVVSAALIVLWAWLLSGEDSPQRQPGRVVIHAA